MYTYPPWEESTGPTGPTHTYIRYFEEISYATQGINYANFDHIFYGVTSGLPNFNPSLWGLPPSVSFPNLYINPTMDETYLWDVLSLDTSHAIYDVFNNLDVKREYCPCCTCFRVETFESVEQRYLYGRNLGVAFATSGNINPTCVDWGYSVTIEGLVNRSNMHAPYAVYAMGSGYLDLSGSEFANLNGTYYVGLPNISSYQYHLEHILTHPLGPTNTFNYPSDGKPTPNEYLVINYPGDYPYNRGGIFYPGIGLPQCLSDYEIQLTNELRSTRQHDDISPGSLYTLYDWNIFNYNYLTGARFGDDSIGIQINQGRYDTQWQIIYHASYSYLSTSWPYEDIITLPTKHVALKPVNFGIGFTPYLDPLIYHISPYDVMDYTYIKVYWNFQQVVTAEDSDIAQYKYQPLGVPSSELVIESLINLAMIYRIPNPRIWTNPITLNSDNLVTVSWGQSFVADLENPLGYIGLDYTYLAQDVDVANYLGATTDYYQRHYTLSSLQHNDDLPYWLFANASKLSNSLPVPVDVSNVSIQINPIIDDNIKFINDHTPHWIERDVSEGYYRDFFPSLEEWVKYMRNRESDCRGYFVERFPTGFDPSDGIIAHVHPDT